jgi:dihydroflavonol-4-reductase
MVGRYYWYRHTKARRLGFRPRRARTAFAEAIAWLAASPHVPRETRARMLLSDEVYAARAALAADEARLQAVA